jgi:enoyl-CoA hydratase
VGRAQAGMLSQQHIASLYTHMRSVRKPIIAAVNGAAAGGGLAFALASDIRVASQSAKFNVAFVKIGLSGCDVGVSYLLPRLIGASKAFEMMLTGCFVLADEAERIGLVSRVVPDGEVVDAALEIAGQITGNSPFGVWMTKEVMWSNLEAGSMQAAMDLENRTQILTTFTEDLAEAMLAFLEKRKPEFRNR